jgi:hypothetical protein
VKRSPWSLLALITSVHTPTASTSARRVDRGAIEPGTALALMDHTKARFPVSLDIFCSSTRSALFGFIAAAFTALGTTGCMATVDAQPAYVVTSEAPVVTSEAPVVYVQSAPVNIEAYPREYYGGRYVYLADGRWYSRSPRGWAVYHREPIELGRRRVVIERAPRYTPRGRVHRYARSYTR